MAQPRLSLVIPTRNRPDALGRLLGQIACQTLPSSDLEVIVVDDGSDPALEEQALRDRFGLELRVLRRDRNHGAHESRADGARIASGVRTLFLDDDVVLEPDVLADHAVDDGHFSVGPIFYERDSIRTPYTRMQARFYDEYFGSMVAGPHRTRDVEFFICNTSGPAAEFSDFLDTVERDMLGIPLGGEGFDESIMHIEARKRGYWFNILPRAVVWHADTRSLADACRGKRRNGNIACKLALTRGDTDLARIVDIRGILAGRQGRAKMLKAMSVWQAPVLVDGLASLLTFLADKGALPSRLCRLPIAIAFWQGVRDEAPSIDAFHAKLSADPA